VVRVHGPGGIGKSALLRQVADRGRAAGWTPVFVEGRDLPPVPDAIGDALAAAHELERPLILIDTYERMAALGGHLRRELLPSLPEHAIVVVAGRGSPERGWFEGGWETITREIELGPLSLSESEELLGAHGLSGVRRDELAHWAGGSPLALTLSIAAAQNGGWSPGRGETDDQHGGRAALGARQPAPCVPARRPGARGAEGLPQSHPGDPSRYLELGMAPPATAEPEPAAPPRSGADPEVVREALRNLRLPHALAQSPLATGDGVEERAAAVRTLLEDPAGRAFGDTESERLMRRVLERGYLDPAVSHEQAADELNLSRAAYFRRLKLASERLADVLGT
jgi:hypothetical protein